MPRPRLRPWRHSERAIALAVGGVLAGAFVALAQPDAGASGHVPTGAAGPRTVTTGPGAGRTAARAAVLPLVESRAETVLPAAVPDPGPADQLPDGTVATPRAPAVLTVSPDGEAVGVLPLTTIGGAPTTVPVLAARDGWLQVLLPSRPAGSSAWVRATDVTTAHSRWAVSVSIGERTMTLLHDGTPTGVWRVAVGAPGTPTPATRTFVAALLRESPAERPVLGDYVVALGAHSPVLATFDGGPGTIGLHGWPADPGVFGTAVSNGCVRMPSDAVAALTQVPLGSPVVLRP